jgi:hypothetical protein
MKSLFILLFAATLTFGSNIVKNFTFSKNDLRIQKQDGYDLLEMKNFNYPTEEGKPSLPYYSISVLIPPTAEIKEVKIIDYEKISIPGEYLLYPTQRPMPVSQHTPIQFVPPDEEIYSLTTEYPKNRLNTIKSGCKSGFRIAGIFLYPLSYIPKERKLFLYKRLKLRIEFEEGIYPLQNLTISQKSLFSQDVRSLVINPEDINRFSPPIHQTDDPSIDYIIITSTGLKGNFVPLVNWLRKTGFWADTISTTRINTNYTGRDLQEKMRNFIKDYFNTQGLKYVLLAGDNSIVPSRGCYSRVPSSPPSVDSFIPCDLYYFDCLEWSWDGNQNNIFGDTFIISGRTDTVDLYYDVYGARWSVQTGAEVDTMIRKLMTYTKNPDTLYQKRMLLPAAFLWSGYNHQQSQDTIANLSPAGWSDRVINQGTNDALRWQVRDSLNTGFGFSHLVAHGNDLATWINTQPQYHRNDPATQTNYNTLTIANSNACYSGNFEYSDCLAEEMMKARGSAIGVMMNSRYGWGLPPWIGPSELLDIRFYQYFFTHDSIRIAHSHQSSKEYYRNSAISQQVWRWCYYELNLLGEPSMIMWKDYPKKMVASFTNPINTGNQSFAVTVTSQSSPVSQAIVALWKGNEVYIKGATNTSGQVTLSINPTTAGYMYVTVTAKNKLPCEDSCQVIAITNDVGVIQIINPTGTIDSGTVVIPQARVKNYSTTAASFPVIFQIGSFYTDTANVTNLAAGDSTVVSFTNWTALPRGTHATKCSTAYASDQNTSNDAMSGSVTVRVRDVGVTQIDIPTGTIDSTAIIYPRAQVRNYGSATETFNVTFRIFGTSYVQTRIKTLTAGVQDTVNFPSWAPVRGSYTTRCSTYLSGDIRYSNDTLSGSFTIRVQDVGVTQILAPTGTIDSGTVVTPQARVKNYGTTAASFPVIFQIGSFYTDTANVTNLAAGDSTVASFTSWNALQPGTHTTNCTTALASDQNTNNDAMSGSVTVSVFDVGVTQIIAPTGTVDSGFAVTPQARVRNYSTTPLSFPVIFRISSFYNDTQNVNNLGPGDSILVSFASWTPLLRGTHSTRCTTALSGDVNATNDALSGSVFVLAADVGVVQIIAPVGNISIGSNVTPSTRIANYGVKTEIFPIYFRIISGTDSIYSDDTMITIQPNQDSIIDFTSWTATSGSYRSFVRTVLAGDQIASNDTVSRTFLVSEMGWQAMADVPSTPSGKNPKSGSCMAGLEATGLIYFLKASNRPDFYSYVPDPSGLGTWLALETIPKGDKSTDYSDGKYPKRGAAMAAYEPGKRVYVVRGNNRLGFWEYQCDTLGDTMPGWYKLATIPAGAKRCKYGTGLVHVTKEGKDYLFLMKGAKTSEFYLYDIETNTWAAISSPPVGASGKTGYKKGSCFAYDGSEFVYILQGYYGSFFKYKVEADSWAELKWYDYKTYRNRDGRKKKPKDGASLVYHDNNVYMLKGGNTVEVWKYDIALDDWSQMGPADIWDIPLLPSNKKVKDGGAMIKFGNYFYASKGKNTPEFYRHGAPASSIAIMPIPKTTNEGMMAKKISNDRFKLTIIPNPTTKMTLVQYNLLEAEPVTLNLYDITGTLVKSYQKISQAKNGSIRIDMGTLSQGVYILKFNSSEFSTTRKLVIEK